jgi:glutathione S-transferase
LERRQYDVMKGETRTPEYLQRINANGRVPVLQVGDRMLPESNAAIAYLASGSPLIPEDNWDRADMLRWMFWEQYNHEPNIATLRFWLAFVGLEKLSPLQRALVDPKLDAGNAALALMNRHLGEHDWMAADAFTLADIALYAYTHVAEDGGAFDLSAYPNVRKWLARVAGRPCHIPIDA